MDNMMSQGLYGGFGGQGMGVAGMNGMNSMNMNMGMGGGYSAGQGVYDGWNGQAGWSAGQDKFNANGGNATNGMTGEHGANAAGYHHHHPNAAAGYNLQSRLGNYSQMSHNQQYSKHDSRDGFRGPGYFPRGPRAMRGPGRGYGQTRGGRAGDQGYGVGNHEAFHQQLPAQLQQQPASDRQTGSSGDQGIAAMNGMETDAKTVSTADEGADNTTTADNTLDRPQEANLKGDQQHTGEVADAAATKASGDSNVVEGVNEANSKDETAEALSRVDSKEIGESNVARTGTTDVCISAPTAPSAKIINAPLGPAALMMQGDPSRPGGRGLGGRGFYRGGGGSGFRGGRGGPGFWSNANGVMPPSGPSSMSKPEVPGVVPVEPKGQGVAGAPTAPKALREGLPNTGLRGRGFAVLGRGGSVVNGGYGGHGRTKRFVAFLVILQEYHPVNLSMLIPTRVVSFKQ